MTQATLSETREKSFLSNVDTPSESQRSSLTHTHPALLLQPSWVGGTGKENIRPGVLPLVGRGGVRSLHPLPVYKGRNKRSTACLIHLSTVKKNTRDNQLKKLKVPYWLSASAASSMWQGPRNISVEDPGHTCSLQEAEIRG